MKKEQSYYSDELEEYCEEDEECEEEDEVYCDEPAAQPENESEIVPEIQHVTPKDPKDYQLITAARQPKIEFIPLESVVQIIELREIKELLKIIAKR